MAGAVFGEGEDDELIERIERLPGLIGPGPIEGEYDELAWQAPSWEAVWARVRPVSVGG